MDSRISRVDDTRVKIRDIIKASTEEQVGILESHRNKSWFDQECTELANVKNYFGYKIQITKLQKILLILGVIQLSRKNKHEYMKVKVSKLE